jgi:hypothetical protein
MWWKNKARTFPPHTGGWPNGQPQSVRDAAGHSNGRRGYDVYMVVIGDCDSYEVLAVYENRDCARQKVREYHAARSWEPLTASCAWVEEISFYPSERESLVSGP